MSLATAQAFTFSLACTLMTSIVLFRTELGGYGVPPIAEYDGASETVVHTYEPYLEPRSRGRGYSTSACRVPKPNLQHDIDGDLCHAL